MICWSTIMKNNFINPKEWIWLTISIFLILLASTIPYLVGYNAQDEDVRFAHAAFDPQDIAAHHAAMQLGYQGHWKFRLLFSPDPQQGAYVRLLYIFLGHLARWFELSIPLTYQIARLIFGFTACLAVYVLFATIFQHVHYRRLGFLLAVLGSGLGWLMWLIAYKPLPFIDPIDFWLMDAYLFFGIMVFPHFGAVATLILTMVITYQYHLKHPSPGKLILIAFCSLLLQAIQPFAPTLGFLAIGLLFIGHTIYIRGFSIKKFGELILIALIQLPLLIYNYYVFQNDPVFNVFSSQIFTHSPPLEYYLWGYGLFWPFVIYVLFKRKTYQQPFIVAMVGWLFTALILAYLPWQFQRRMVFVYAVPLSILLVYNVKEYLNPWFNTHAPNWLSSRKTSILLLILPFFMLSNIYLVGGISLYIIQRPDDLFHSAALVEAIEKLEPQASPEDVVLGAPETGKLTAASTGIQVFIANEFETINYVSRRLEIEAFFTGHLPLEDLSANIDWVVYGPYEKEFSQDFKPGKELVIAIQNQEVTIYQVIH